MKSEIRNPKHETNSKFKIINLKFVSDFELRASYLSAKRGFSLIEVTIAIAIIGVIIVATAVLLQRLPVNGREVRDQDVALKIAKTEIETLRAGGYDALPGSGTFTDPLLGSLTAGSASLTVAAYSTKTKRADVSVSWTGAGSVPRTLTLTTLISQNSGL